MHNLHPFAYQAICDVFAQWKGGLLADYEATDQIAKLVQFEKEQAYNFGFQRGKTESVDLALRRMSVPVVDEFSTRRTWTKTHRLHSPESTDSMEITNEHTWREGLAATRREDERRYND